jgi:orotidine-5'-phosphate decarboxylase
MQATDKLIVALDVPTAADALNLVGALGDTVSFYKVGMQLYFAEGNALVKELLTRKKRVFLDLKINDIPETVALAVGSLARLGVDYLTLFTAEKQLAAARKVVDGLKSPLKLLNVTVLTSDASDYESVELRAQLSLDAGSDGLICSGQETAALRTRFGAGPIIVNPGIRPAGGDVDDQVRVVTPAMAIRAGATNIVVGRPITRAADPRGAAEAIVAEIRGA